MPENNTIHIINGRVPQWEFHDPDVTRYYVEADYVEADYVE